MHTVHLSDFIVLHMLRQGKMTTDTVKLLRSQFQLLDRDASGVLSREEACAEPSVADPIRRPSKRIEDRVSREERKWMEKGVIDMHWEARRRQRSVSAATRPGTGKVEQTRFVQSVIDSLHD